MKAVIYFAALCLSSAWTDMAGECEMASFYQELGCTAMPRADNSSECPETFSCQDLHPDPNMCYYRGKPYSNGDMIPQKLIANPCSQACSCQVREGRAAFECAAVDCVETFNRDQQQCIATKELDSCCSTGTVCGKDAIASLKTCEVDGKTYKEGQVFEPKNTHKTCICTPDWNGTVDNLAYCKDVNCGIEIHYQAEVQEKCAPVFFGDRKGCPITFSCPTAATNVIKHANVRGVNEQCVFGNMTLGVGDELTDVGSCTSCVCQVPPFVSCMMKSNCSE